MATSSIIEDIRVNNPKAIEAFVEAMETSAQNFHPRTPDEQSAVVSDPERIKSFVQKCLEKNDSYFLESASMTARDIYST